MSGIDTIIAEIRTASENTARETVAAAQKEADAVLAAARKDAADQTAKLRRINEKKETDLASRAQSQADLRRRQLILAKKQELITEAIRDALAEVNALPADRYFGAVARMAAAAAHRNESGKIALSAADLARIPQDFEASLNKLLPEGSSLTVSDVPASIEGGSVLIYDGIEENCSFEEIASSRKDELQDTVRKILFD